MKSRYTRKPKQEELYRLYINERKTLAEIGEMFETSGVTIRNWVKAAHIELRSLSEAVLRGTPRPTNDELERMYIDDKMTTVEMADSIGVAFCTVNRWLKIAGIPLRQTSESMLKGKQKPSVDDLYKLYIEDMLNTPDIAEMYDVSSSSILKWLKESDISVRTNSESQLAGKYRPPDDALYKLYVDDMKSVRCISNIYGISQHIITKCIINAGMPYRGIPKGEYNHNWKGGVSNDPYCVLWTESLREDIRQKYDRECFICGKTEKDNGRKLDVHHTNYGKMCLCEYDCQLVPLCVSCHAKTGHNRFQWYSFILCKLLLESSAQFVNMDNY